MEYEFDFTYQIPLADDEAYAYEAVAFNGQAYYFTLPQFRSIHIFQTDLSFYSACACEHSYRAICYDAMNDCFWASCDEQPNQIYALSNRLEILDYLSIPFDQTLSILNMSYHDEHDSLLICTTEQIIELTKDGQVRNVCHPQFDAYLSVLAFHDTYSAIRTTNTFTFLDVLSEDGYILESNAVTISQTLKNILWDPIKTKETNTLCFICLLINEEGKPCFCHCMCKPCPPNPCICDNKNCCPSDCKSISICKVLSSIACMEAALAHILNAEGEKLQKAVQLADNICELLEVNRLVSQTITDVTMLEQVLYAKLLAIKEISDTKCCDCCESMDFDET